MMSLFLNKSPNIKPTKKFHINIEKKHFETIDEEKLKIIWFGHSCVLIFIDGKKYCDPSLSNNASPLLI